MASGFLSGAALGLAATVAAAAVLSVAVGVPEDPDRTRVEAPEPTVAETDDGGPSAGAESDGSEESAAEPASDTAEAGPEDDTQPMPAEDAERETSRTELPPPPEPARRPEAESRVAVGETVPLDTPETPREGDVPGGDTAPAGRPEAVQESGPFPAPDAPQSPGRVAVSTDAPVMAPPAVEEPQAPGAEAAPSIATEPAQPPSPSVPGEDSGLVADAGEEDETNDDAAPSDAAPEAQSEIGATPPPAPESDPAPVAPSEDAAPRLAAAETGPEAPEPDAAPEPELARPPRPEVEANETGSEETEGDEAGTEESGASERPGVGAPATRLTDRDDAVPVHRPGDDPDVPENAPEAEAEESGPPIERYAAPAVEAGDRPRMSVILIDDAGGPLGPQAVGAFPFPVSFAVDPALPDASERMAAYREKGFEVLALAGVPEGAAASDVEVALEAAFSALPQSVGVLEAPGSMLQGWRAVSDQLTEVLNDTGHGLVMLPNGLNTAQQLAARAGVPSGTVFRDFDGDGQDPTVQRRFLDQAAFRARQDGPVIMLGRLRADTLSALLLWSLQDRASQVALVPVSQILRGDY
ncbi:polysaccharide deacteylase family 2 protein [Roseivivax sediminis]|uniref:Uncharacterized conserved protein YibQ, putative polysaccharide deacetylase 2 family n=1 Tax=Roseivivax sediminis TaxID=936889 RepID=A0A1I1WYQ9_9RHOB|nr:polysaccharide deacteylase family 2 protein [Roseivivax sediminis]SFD99508.1 Uncharacterized conserved protein YibQ, putative polysaccharide deacetylase 2 family [Roseivivax sediminis]